MALRMSLHEAVMQRDYSKMKEIVLESADALDRKDAQGRFPVELAVGDYKALEILQWRKVTDVVALRLMMAGDMFQLDYFIEGCPRYRRLLRSLDLWAYFMAHGTSFIIEFILYFEARVPQEKLQPLLTRIVQYKRIQQYKKLTRNN